MLNWDQIYIKYQEIGLFWAIHQYLITKWPKGSASYDRALQGFKCSIVVMIIVLQG